MSVGVLQATGLVEVAERAAEHEPVQAFREASGWSPENFAREQVRGLVRQVFFSSAVNPVRQVVFSAAESGTDVGRICQQVAESLALDVSGSVAVISRDRTLTSQYRVETEEEAAIDRQHTSWLRHCAIRLRRNLWLIPENRVVGGKATGMPLSSRLCELRREFEYSIVQGPAAGESSEAAALGQSADGIVLVLAAQVTRRAMALKIKETLERAHVRLLGTVLSERRFPIPEAIYRRL